jgi:ABC-type multidrug transport system fused ATPase/permease subunit
MTKEVYLYIFKTYGKNLWQWVGFILEAAHIVLIRIYIVVLMAKITTLVASGDFTRAKEYILYFFLAYIAGVLLGSLADLLNDRTENIEYNRQRFHYYQKLTGKDIAFYRDNQTGYLVSTFRQFLDSSVQLVMFFRGEALGTFISLILPPVILYLASPTVGLVAVAVVLIQFIYISWGLC